MLPILILIAIVVALGILFFLLKRSPDRQQEYKYAVELGKFLGFVFVIVFILLLLLRGIRYL